MPTDPRGPADVVSPELVLVASPEDAKRAREQLPDPRAVPPRRESRPLASHPRPAVPPKKTRRKWPRRTAVVLAAVLGLAGAVAGGFAASRDSSGSSSAPSRAATPLTVTGLTVPGTQPPPTVTSTTPRTTTSLPTTTIATKPASTPPATPPAKTQPKQKTTPRRKPARTGKKKAAPARPIATGFVPARTWSWQPQAKARRYLFTLTRNGRRVVAAHTTRPRFVLPKRFRFAAGRYRWRVVAVRTKRPQRKVLVDSKFVLSRAGAAAANG